MLPLLATAFGIGVALAGAPGQVQAVLLAEATRGGIGRGFQALAGASLTFGLLLVSVALGLTSIALEGLLLSLLRGAGGALLIWLAIEAIRATEDRASAPPHGIGLPPIARGSLAVLLNPGAWLFLGAVASPLLATAMDAAGSAGAVSAAFALMAGAALGDMGVVLLGGHVLRRAVPRARRWVHASLAAILAIAGGWLLVSAFAP